jgi:hypothetical protein
MGTIIRIPTRRAILAGAASLPALAIPVAAMPAADPVYAAIEQYREARRALAEDAAKFPGRDIDEDLTDDEVDAVDAMLRTKPTTLLGCAALLREVAKAGDDMGAALFETMGGWDIADAGRDLLPMLAAFIPSARACRARASA